MLHAKTLTAVGPAILALSLLAATAAQAQAAKAPYPTMAPIAQYRIANPADEIALARSAAPPSISGDADVMVLGARGYETAVKGRNGFVCIVERAWAGDVDDPDFWNPKLRAPTCFNALSARSVLPNHLKRTEWVLAGASKAEIVQRTKAAIAAGEIREPDAGSMCYMMSKDGYLSTQGGHWHPHLMFYVPRSEASAWGANQKGSPVLGGGGGLEPGTVFFAIVPNWSDGTPAAAMAM